jgi:hypothetical protein
VSQSRFALERHSQKVIAGRLAVIAVSSAIIMFLVPCIAIVTAVPGVAAAGISGRVLSAA